MNKNNKKLSAVITCFLGFFVVASVWANQKTSSQMSPKTQTKAVVKTQTKKVSAPAEASDKKDMKPLANPFRYRIPHAAGGFVPALPNKIPSGIKVLAIMIIEGQKPLAVLEVPDMVDAIYVRSGDIIGVQSNAKNFSNKNKNSNNIIYLKIEKITEQQVVLYPQKNPAGKQVLR